MNNPEGGRAADALYHLVEKGSADLDERNDALRQVIRNLRDDCMAASPKSMRDPVDWPTRQRMEAALSDAGLLAAYLLEWMAPFNAGELKLALTRRRASGPLVNWPEHASNYRAAIAGARAVERLEQRGMRTKKAVGLVAEKMGLTRSEVYKGRRARRKGVEFKVFDRWWV